MSTPCSPQASSRVRASSLFTTGVAVTKKTGMYSSWNGVCCSRPARLSPLVLPICLQVRCGSSTAMPTPRWSTGHFSRNLMQSSSLVT